VSAHRSIFTVPRVAGGVVAGVIACELVLRVFVTPGVPARPDIVADSFGTVAVARRQIEEGVATSHFSPSGARLTGNPALRAQPPVLILGDSYVEAEQVPDHHTMGARLETLARANGSPIDVRQFGWMGASPAQYILTAPEVREKWKPGHVFIVLSANDFDHNGLLLAEPRFRVEVDGTLRILGGPISPVTAHPPRASVLAMLVRHRWAIIKRRVSFDWLDLPDSESAPTVVQASAVEPGPDSLEYVRAPEAVVRALRDAYGSSLSLIYLVPIGLGGDSTPSDIELRFLDACTRIGADCVSTREAMLAARREGRIGHGAGISALGSGHLNAAGHEVIGKIMWTRIGH
jgi:hypothetical protein